MSPEIKGFGCVMRNGKGLKSWGVFGDLVVQGCLASLK